MEQKQIAKTKYKDGYCLEWLTGFNNVFKTSSSYLFDKEEFKTLCCNFSRKVGEKIMILSEWSPKRWMIQGEIGIHKVKKSTVNRCCEEYTEILNK